jgi:hypothetical protein
MTMSLDYTINGTIWQSIDKHSSFVIHATWLLFGIFGPSTVFVCNIAVVSEVSYNKNSICTFLFEFIALTDHDVFIL